MSEVKQTNQKLLLPYYVTVTPTLSALVADLDSCNTALQLVPTQPHHEQRLRTESLLKSSLFSARIEGNPLTLASVHPSNHNGPTSAISATKARLEVVNLSAAYEWIATQTIPSKLSPSIIKSLHAKAMNHLDPDAGHWRSEESAIFNQAGVAVYLTPSPNQIQPMLQEWLHFNRSGTYPPAVMACMAHLIFEKIHPFLDGNGRVGRLLLCYQLHQAQLQMRGMLSVEEVLDQRKSDYYDALATNTADITPGVVFLLECLVEAAHRTLNELRQAAATPTKLLASQLLPRRQEILNIIHDHRVVSFDFLSRRFMTIKPSTLHYDLKCLMNQGLITKVGQTRGALYTVIP